MRSASRNGRHPAWPILVLLGLIALVAPPSYADPAWVPTGSLITAHRNHTATLLQNGKVLVAGGSLYSDTDADDTDAELYDPATRVWTATGPLNKPRYSHAATLLPDGKVLLVGGAYTLDNSTELYDPATGIWSLTGNLNVGRRYRITATLLQNGKVLVAGGCCMDGSDYGLDSAELYDPATATWTPTGSLQVGRYGHTMTRLQDGRVLVTGGYHDSDEYRSGLTKTSELYDPGTGKWTSTADLPSAVGDHSATLLLSGKVLIAGGFHNDNLDPLAEDFHGENLAELFDPATGTWAHTGSLSTVRRNSPSATLLTNGEVLVAGGLYFPGDGLNVYALETAERYASDQASWSSAASMNVARDEHTATLLRDGSVLVAGGSTWAPGLGVTKSAELYGPPPGYIDAGFTGAWYDPAQSGHGIFIEVLPDYRLLAWWFTFNPAGTEQAWFGGVGTYSLNSATITDVVQTTGGRWIPNFDKTQVANHPWGSLSITFSDDSHGRADFSGMPGYGSGSMALTRLTQLAPPKGTGTWIGSPGAVTSERFGGDKPNVYFSSSPDLVYKLDPTNKLTRIAGTGIPGYSGDGGPAAQAQLNFPLSYPELESHPHDYYPLVGGLATDLYANLYIADAYNNRVRKIDSNGIISTFAGNGSRANAGDGGVATNASIYWPQGVAADFSGNVYVASQFGSLRKVAPGGGISTVTGSNCGPGFLGPGLCVPEQISADTNGNVYVPDGYCRVRKVQPDGSVVTVAGDDTHPGGGFAFTCGFTGDGGPATSAALSLQPYAVAADYVGNLYIADTFNSCIRKVTSAGIISTFAGTCTSPGFSGDDGPATSAQLDHPYGVSVDPFQVVLIADTGNHRIRKVSATGTITTIAGSGGPGVIGPSFSGAWYDPAQSGHGIFIEVLPGNLLLAWWFTFNPAGTEQAWFGGVGSYNGATATITDVVQTTGGRWIPNFDKTQIVNHPWGSLTFSFTDCNHGKVDFNSVLGYGSGSMNLTRLTTPAGLTCP